MLFLGYFFIKFNLHLTLVGMFLKKKRLPTLLAFVFVNTLVIYLISNRKWIEDSSPESNTFLFVSPNVSDYWRLPLKIKSILFWSGASRSEMTIFGTGHDTFVHHGCPVSDCEIVNSPQQYPGRPLDSYDAIIFNFNDEFVMKKRPVFNRLPHQRFIFFTQEAPPAIEYLDISGYKNYFNWTMTYRMESDVPLLYGRILPKPSAPKTSQEIKAKIRESTKKLTLMKRKGMGKKKKLVAAMISHCTTKSRRETYISQLKKHVKVDVFGTCNEGEVEQNCDPDELVSSNPECYDMLESNYKFYLSFENSICPDYVTEKFFKIMRLRDIVPVVYGGANYAKLAPKHSYIDALHFRPQQLAAYLKTLAENETLYNEYLWWKDDYIVEAGLEQMVRTSFCDLCLKLHQVDKKVKVYTSLASQWDPAHCHSPYSDDKKTEQMLPGNTTFNALESTPHHNTN
jgi:alpha-1,3-fucosyltransferase